LTSIYLDTNILPQYGNLDSLEFSILVALAGEMGYELVVPELVADEATSKRLRTIEAAFDVFQRAHRDARIFASIPLFPDLPVPGELAREFRRKLEALCRIASMPEGAGEEALRRETFRLRPAREGKGARDVAIWLTVKSAHEASGVEGYFISDNVKDFADPSDRSRLHPDLRAEIEGPALHFARSVERLLEMLAAQNEPFIDNAFLRDNNEECLRAVVRAVDGVNLGDLVQQMPEAPIVGSRRRFYVAGPVLGESLGINEKRGFGIQGRRVTIAWTRWRLVIPVGILERSGTGMVQTMVEITCQGSFQIWARLGGETSMDVEVSSVGTLKLID
jgi:PIN domain